MDELFPHIHSGGINFLLMIGGAFILCIATSAVMGVQRMEPHNWEMNWVVVGNEVNIEYRSLDKNRQAWFRFVPYSINFWQTNIPQGYKFVRDTTEIQFLENLFVGDVEEGANDLHPTRREYFRDGDFVEFIEFNFSRTSHESAFEAGFYILPRLIGDRRYFHEEKMIAAEYFLVNRRPRHSIN